MGKEEQKTIILKLNKNESLFLKSILEIELSNTIELLNKTRKKTEESDFLERILNDDLELLNKIIQML